MKCKVDECDRDAVAHGLCHKHYSQRRRNMAKPCKAGCGRPAEKRGLCNVCYNKALRKAQPVCSFPGCNKPQVAKGYCVACYTRLYRKGTAERDKDGRSKHPLHRTWEAIIKRCSVVSAGNYKYYGARGIKVCDRWLNDFWSFVEDMGDRPSPLHTIERLDHNGNYEPGNCCWALQVDQSRNKRNTKLTEELVREIKSRHRRGERCTEIAKSLGANYQTVNSVIVGQSWKDVEPGAFD